MTTHKLVRYPNHIHEREAALDQGMHLPLSNKGTDTVSLSRSSFIARPKRRRDRIQSINWHMRVRATHSPLLLDVLHHILPPLLKKKKKKKILHK